MEKWTRLLVVLATMLLLLVFVAAAIRIALFIQHTILLFSLGALVAYSLDPLVEGLRRFRFGKGGWRISRELSVTGVFAALFIVIGLFAWLLGGNLVHQFTWVSNNHQIIWDRASARAADFDAYLSAHGLHFSLEDEIKNPPPEVQNELKKIAGSALPVIGDTVKTVGESGFVLLFALYFLLFASDMKEKLNNRLPESIRDRAILWETDINRILGGFVRGQLVIALTMGAAAAVGCLLIGIRPWLLIGVFVTFASLIPVLGPYIGAIPALIAALISPVHFMGWHPGPVLAAVLVAIWFVIINETGSKILYPKLVGSALGLHVVLVLFVIFAGLEIDGIVGVLFAAPLTALVMVSVVHLYRYWQGLPDDLLSRAPQAQAVQVRSVE